MNVIVVSVVVLFAAGTAQAAWGDPVEPTCTKGWYMYNGTRCLSLFTQEETWDEARRQCQFQEPDSDLTIVDTADKKAFVHTLVHANAPLFACGLLGIKSYWIGANDRRQESVFEWLDTEQKLDYTNWAFLEPNNIFGEDCVEMVYASSNWNDEDCEATQCFVCEMALPT